MKKRGGRFLLFLGAGLAAMAFIVIYLVTSKGLGSTQASPAPTAIPMSAIAVINQDVPAYTILDASNVATIDVDASSVMSASTSNPAVVYGKMTLLPLTKGQAILTNQLTTTGFSNIIEKGKRAFTLAIPERSTFAETLTENDYVDVIWTHKYEVIQMLPGPDGRPVEHKKELPTTKTLLQDVRVLRVMSLRPEATQQSTSAQTDQASAVSARKTNAALETAYAPDAPSQAVLILALNDQQAEVLKFANENGTIDLTLRSSATFKGDDGKDIRGDHDPDKTTGITDKVLVESYGLLLPEILVK